MNEFKKHYINGQFVDSHGKEKFNLFNPSTGELTGTVTLGDEVDLNLAIQAAKEAFKTFSITSLKQRADLLDRLSEAFAKRKDEHAQALISEYGGTKAFANSIAEWSGKYFKLMKESMMEVEFSKKFNETLIKKEAVGVVGIITPWNASPLFICSKFATAIAAGCTVVVKPSEMSAEQSQLILECFHEANIPPGVFNLVNGRGDIAGAALVRSADVAKISFTGSTLVGKWIAREGAETMKRVTLELGGKSPNILLDDADLQKAIPLALNLAFMNNGQSCIAGTRLLVPEYKLEDVKQAILNHIKDFKVGNPVDESVNIGPMVSDKQYQRVQTYIQKGLDAGAQILVGGLGKPAGLENGNFVKPTVFFDVKNEMTIAKEEIFGPVLSVITYKTEEDAISIANDTSYGLAGYLSSANVERAMKVADRIEAGRININAFTDDPKAPSGGYKQSGIGRENGVMGIEAYLETKTVYR